MYGYDNSTTDAFYGGFIGVDYVKDDMNVISLLLNIIEAPSGSAYYNSRLYTLSFTYSYYLYRNTKVIFETEYDFLRSSALITLGADYAF